MTKYIVSIKYSKIAIPDKEEFKTMEEAVKRIKELENHKYVRWASFEEVKA